MIKHRTAVTLRHVRVTPLPMTAIILLVVAEWARTYAWYQNLLNLRAAELYEEHGSNFLRVMKDHLAWEEAGDWTTESLLASLEGVAPGFEAWAWDLHTGDYLPRDD